MFVGAAEGALAAALSHRFSVALQPSSVTPAGQQAAAGARRFDLAPGSGLTLSEPAAVKPVLYPVGDRLIAAYVVEFYAGTAQSSDADAFRYVVAAADGRVLEARDLTVHEGNPQSQPAFTYRVFADADGDLRPFDGPVADFTPHPTGIPDGSEAPYILPSLVSVFGLNWQPSPRADPWLPATATQTNGNNVDAYVDHRPPDGLTLNAVPTPDFRADITAARTFDRVYDTSLSPIASADQSKAAITNAFFVTNWLHDYWYDSGFNEAAGNAQNDNYGRGGVGGDSMRVEVQDNYFGGSRNNANMSTPSDGLRPRMQMFAWSGDQQAFITLTPGGNLAVGTAAFGPTNFDVTALVMLGNDGIAAPADPGPPPLPAGTITDGCEPIPGVAGRIVLVDRGRCAFVLKAQNVQAAGGVGMIIANNVAGPAPGMGGVAPDVTIPVLSISLADANALKAALMAGAVTARMFRFSGVERDSALDNGILAHEWGHYLHHRLADCGSQQCGGQSEGWGDFVALHMMSREGDNLDGVYSASTYAGAGLNPNAAYFGVRRVPYSVDFSKNALTFKHISDGQALPVGPPIQPGGPNSEVHNVGEIWATMLWEGYVGLQNARKGRSFEDVRRAMANYIVGGLQLAPTDATFTEQRDAILAAAVASRPDHDAGDPDDVGAGGADVMTLAKAFARRGAGTCAISPPRFSTNLVGVTESFEVSPRAVIGGVQLVEGRRSCDGDGLLDAGEEVTLVVTVMNAGPLELAGTTVSVNASLTGVVFPSGNTVQIARIAPFTSRQVSIPVSLEPSFSGIGQLQLTVTVSNSESCETTLTQIFRTFVNADDAPGTSAVDMVEALSTAWTPTGAGAAEIWSRVEAAPFNHVWLGRDSGSISDTQLTSPPLNVSATDPLIISFLHRHSFEASDGTLWDGGVIEVSVDGGVNWVDLNTIVPIGYTGALTTISGNPLGGRQAFSGPSAGYPAFQPVSLNAGTALAGQTIRLRFRIGTDGAVGDVGWELDNLAFQGITNTPFSALVPETAVCRAR